MMRLDHRFVEFIPKELDNDVLYISIRFKTSVHKCACGCGIKTVTPISPTDWKLIFNGKNVSLHPSIGNWGFPCQSPYWITENKVEWAPKWSKYEIEEGRSQSRKTKEDYYKEETHIMDSNIGKAPKSPWWKFKWLFGNKAK